MPKLVSIDDQRYAALTLQSLRVTIGPLQASTTSLESQESYLTAGMLPYNRNVTLQTFLSSTRDFYRLNSTFARLYNAAPSPASRRLRSAGSLAKRYTQRLSHRVGSDISKTSARVSSGFQRRETFVTTRPQAECFYCFFPRQIKKISLN